MIRFVLIAAGVALMGTASAEAAPKAKAPFPMAADGTTNVADCAKVDASFRNECISRSRPLTAKEIYAKPALADAAKAKAEKAAKVAAEKAAKAAAKVKAAIPAAVVGAPKGFKIAKDGTTNVADCAKAAPAVRNECISRARPMTGKELAKFVKDRAAATAKTETKPAVKKAAVVPAKAVPAKVVPAKVVDKGFVIAKDGTTNIADCGKANPDFRNECISRARPVTGAQIYGASTPASKSKS